MCEISWIKNFVISSCYWGITPHSLPCMLQSNVICFLSVSFVWKKKRHYSIPTKYVLLIKRTWSTDLIWLTWGMIGGNKENHNTLKAARGGERQARSFLRREGQESSLSIWTQPRHRSRIRSLSAISISACVWCQHHHKESSLLDCAGGSADTEWGEREGAVATRERERVTQCDYWDWKRSALWRSLMYDLIWASTVVRACSIGLKFTKLMTHINTKKFCFMSLLNCGRIQSLFSCTSGHSFVMYLLRSKQRFQMTSLPNQF